MAKLPLCKILKAAPWQVKAQAKKRQGPGSTHPWGVEELTVAKELTPEEVRELFWDRDNARTPKSGTPKLLADDLKDED